MSWTTGLTIYFVIAFLCFLLEKANLLESVKKAKRAKKQHQEQRIEQIFANWQLKVQNFWRRQIESAVEHYAFDELDNLRVDFGEKSFTVSGLTRQTVKKLRKHFSYRHLFEIALQKKLKAFTEYQYQAHGINLNADIKWRQKLWHMAAVKKVTWPAQAERFDAWFFDQVMKLKADLEEKKWEQEVDDWLSEEVETLVPLHSVINERSPHESAIA